MWSIHQTIFAFQARGGWNVGVHIPSRAPHVRGPHWRAGGRAAGARVGRSRLAQPPGGVPRSSTRGIVGPTKSGRERKVPLTGKLEAALRRIKHLWSDRV